MTKLRSFPFAGLVVKQMRQKFIETWTLKYTLSPLLFNESNTMNVFTIINFENNQLIDCMNSSKRFFPCVRWWIWKETHSIEKKHRQKTNKEGQEFIINNLGVPYVKVYYQI